jgi:hypothetical protein
LETWNPGRRFPRADVRTAGYAKIESTSVRLIYKLVWATPVRSYDVLNRFEY